MSESPAGRASGGAASGAIEGNPERARAGLARGSALVAMGTALSRVTGFARIAAVAYAIGAGTLAGTYSYANETPNIVYELLLGGVLTATLVPLFVRHFESGDDEATAAVVTVAMLALVALTVVGILAAPWIVDLYTLRVEGPTRAAQQELATNWLRLFMPQMLFYGAVALGTALLNARRRFVAAAFAPVLNNLVVIAVFVVLAQATSGHLGVQRVLDDDGLVLLLGLGTTGGIAAVAVGVAVAVRRAGIRLRFVARGGHPAVRALVRLSGWTAGYVMANQVALSVVTILANDTSGGPFLYASAYAFFQLPYGLVVVSLMTTFAPELARAGARGDVAELRRRLVSGLRMACLFVAPAAGLMIGLARPLVAVLLERGRFSGADAETLAHTVLAFAVGLVPFSVYLFALRAFYSVQDTRTTFLLNCFQNATNIALAFPLYAWLGIPGLALSFALAYFLAAAVTLAVVDRRVGGGARAILAGAASGLVVAATVAGVGSLVATAIGWDGTGRALLAVVLGGAASAVAAVVASVALRVPEIATVRAAVVRRRSR